MCGGRLVALHPIQVRSAEGPVDDLRSARAATSAGVTSTQDDPRLPAVDGVVVVVAEVQPAPLRRIRAASGSVVLASKSVRRRQLSCLTVRSGRPSRTSQSWRAAVVSVSSAPPSSEVTLGSSRGASGGHASRPGPSKAAHAAPRHGAPPGLARRGSVSDHRTDWSTPALNAGDAQPARVAPKRTLLAVCMMLASFRVRLTPVLLQAPCQRQVGLGLSRVRRRTSHGARRSPRYVCYAGRTC